MFSREQEVRFEELKEEYAMSRGWFGDNGEFASNWWENDENLQCAEAYAYSQILKETRLINVSGLDDSDKLLNLIEMFGTCKGIFDIEFKQSVDLNKRDCLWFSGEVAVVKHDGFVFSIASLGDPVGSLVEKKNNNEVLKLQDNKNDGCVNKDFSLYVHNDGELKAAKSKKENDFPYKLNLDFGSWLDVLVTDNTGEECDVVWYCDSNDVFDAVVEVINGADGIIEKIKADLLKEAKKSLSVDFIIQDAKSEADARNQNAVAEKDISKEVQM